MDPDPNPDPGYFFKIYLIFLTKNNFKFFVLFLSKNLMNYSEMRKFL